MGYVVYWDGENNAILVSTPQAITPQADDISLDGLVPIMDFAGSHDIDWNSRLDFRMGDIELVLPISFWDFDYYVAVAEGHSDISVTTIIYQFRTVGLSMCLV